jgi:hypothetical protein
MCTNYIKLYPSCTNLTRLILQVTIPTSRKMSEFFKKSPLTGAEKHPDFQVTLCLHFVTTNVDFAYIESE